MSEIVETLNQWGGNFWGFAWLMLWQSSLLIAVVLAFDLLFARRIRASVRCGLWLVVLVKLMLPPTLALPTGATWWLWRAHPAVEHPVIQNYTVSFDNTVPEEITPSTVPVVMPPPTLKGDAWVLLAVVAMAAGLLSWLAFRWVRLAGKIRRAATAPAELDSLLEEARQLAGLRRRQRLKLIDEMQSPAVYGLWRPVILLPRTLTNQISRDQLRAVLLHEAIHLRRGDVCVNCAQTLLQIAYWWHPLLWLANARIRRLREEAVDDAVMVALQDGADAYAPTLLEVAKYAFRRPLASLGLVGILESRSALRQRVERLVDFRRPRRAGVTFLSLCGIFAFAAVALPMGQGPAQTIGTRSAGSQNSASVTTNGSSEKLEMRTFGVGTNVFLANLRKITGAPISGSDEKNVSACLKQFFEKATVDISPPKTVFFNSRLRGGTLFVYATPRDLAIIERIVERLHESGGGNDGWLKSINAGTAPAGYFDVIADEVTRRAIHDATYSKLNRIHVTLSYDNQSLSEVIRDLEQRSLELDPDKQGIDFLYNPNNIVDDGRVHITLSMNGASLQYVVNEICLVSDHPINYSIGDRGGVVFYAVSKPVYPDAGRKVFYRKLDQIRLNVSYGGQSLSEVILDLSRQTRKLDPDKKGINFLFNPNTTGDVTNKTVDASQIHISLSLNNVDLRDLLNAICLASDHPIKYSVEDYGVIFSAKDTNSEQYEMRTFRVNPKAFHANLTYNVLSDGFSNETRKDANGHGVSELARAFFSKLGVSLDPPETAFYNDGLGVLFVYATPQDLDVIERAVQVLSGDPPMIHIKARFIEVPQKVLSSAVAKSIFSGLTNGAILPRAEFSLFWNEVNSQGGAEEVAEPEVTTISGRQTEMRATVTQSIITNFTVEASAGAIAGSAGPYGKSSDGSVFVPQTEQVQTGLVLDVFPSVLSDGYTINLTTIASQIDFLGYRTSNGLVPNVTTNAAGTGVLPVVNVRDASISRNIWDGQTLVLFPNSEAGWRHFRNQKGKKRISEGAENAKEKEGDKVLIVLTSATLIDAAGNRLHSDDEMAFAQNNIPAQSP